MSTESLIEIDRAMVLLGIMVDDRTIGLDGSIDCECESKCLQVSFLWMNQYLASIN